MKEENHNCIDFEQIKAHIKKFGLSVITVESTEYLPSFAYSIGLWETYKHPEIICFGLDTQTLHAIINDVAELIKSAENINPNLEYQNIFQSNRAIFLKIDNKNIEDYFGVAIEYHDSTQFDALQLIWTDRNNKFPWEVNFEKEFKYAQPLLDRNTNFKFREEKNLGIFTTRQWLEDNEAIIRVVHENNGDWQFFTKTFDLKTAKIVTLEQIVIRDQTLNDVFDLDYGEEAQREFIGDKWHHNKIKSEG